VLPQIAAPGRIYSRSNAGIVVLGRLVEVLTGLPFGRAVADRVASAYGLAELWPSAPAEDCRPGPAVTPPWAPASGLWATTTALARFGALHADPGRPGAGTVPEAVRALSTTPDARLVDEGHGDRIALGGWFTSRDSRLLRATGVHGPWRSWLLVVPHRSFALALASPTAAARPVANELTRWVAEDLFGIPWPGLRRSGQPPPLVDAEAMCGEYRKHLAECRVVLDGDRLRLTVRPERPGLIHWPELSGVPLVPITETAFAIQGLEAIDLGVYFVRRPGSREVEFIHFLQRTARRVGD
jgi:hypothetical protein